MVKLVRVYAQSLPQTRFVGKKYSGSMTGYADQWGKWFERGWFEPLERMYSSCPAGFEDDDAYIGLMKHGPGAAFEYWIGMFLAADADVPGGYESIDFAPLEMGMAWLCGPEAEIYAQEDLAMRGMEEQGMKPAGDDSGAYWMMERYACPRFTRPDNAGNVTLDIGMISGWKAM